MFKLPRFISVLLIAAALAMVPLVGFAQTDLRVVHVLYPNECPVEIRSLRVAEMGIEPQRTFEADKGWLKDLSWEIENSSEKSIEYIEINLDFHGLADREESVFKHHYGQKRNASGEYGGTKVLRSGDTTRIVISDDEYERIMRFIDEKQSGFTISVVEMKISNVVFDDGTTWPRRQRGT